MSDRIKMVSLLRRQESANLADFLAWYRSHATRAAQIPGLWGYWINTAVDDQQPFDGLSELVFEDMDALRAGLDSEAGRASRADTLAHVGFREVAMMHRAVVLDPHEGS